MLLILLLTDLELYAKCSKPVDPHVSIKGVLNGACLYPLMCAPTVVSSFPLMGPNMPEGRCGAHFGLRGSPVDNFFKKNKKRKRFIIETCGSTGF